MKTMGQLFRNQRAVGLNERSFVRELGVKADLVESIENCRHTPAPKLAERIGLDRQQIKVLLDSEGKTLGAGMAPESAMKATPSWRRFMNNHALLERYRVTRRELQILESNFAGTALSTGQFLAILMLIRDIPGNDQPQVYGGHQQRISLTDFQAATEYLLDAIKLTRRNQKNR